MRVPDTDPKEAIPFFERAIQKDPSYAPAYAGLARCYGVMTHFGRIPPGEGRKKQEMYAKRALELDDSLAEAHLVFAGKHGGKGHWKEAEKEYQRALALDPERADTHFWYALFLEMHGRTEEAERHYRKALSLGVRLPSEEAIWV